MLLKPGVLHRALEYYQICSNDDAGLTFDLLRQGQMWSLMLLYGEKGKTMDFSDIIVVCDIKAGRCRQLNEYMKLCESQRSRSFIDLGPRSLGFNIFKLFFL